LLVGEHDVEADAFGADVEGAAVGGFHDAGAAAGHDDQVALVVCLAVVGDHPAELARLVVEVALGEDAFGADDRPLSLRIVGQALCLHLRLGQTGLGDFTGNDLRAAEDYDGGANFVFAEDGLSLVELQLHAHRPLLGAADEVEIELGELVAGRGKNRLAIPLD
jgi:hypothetical protein